MQFTLLSVVLVMASTAIAAPTASSSTSSAPAATPTSNTDHVHWQTDCVDSICAPNNGTLSATGISIYYNGYAGSNAASSRVRFTFEPSINTPSELEPVVIPTVFTRDSSVVNPTRDWRLDFDLPCGVQAGSYDLALRDYVAAGVQNLEYLQLHAAGPYDLPATDAC